MHGRAHPATSCHVRSPVLPSTDVLQTRLIRGRPRAEYQPPEVAARAGAAQHEIRPIGRIDSCTTPCRPNTFCVAGTYRFGGSRAGLSSPDPGPVSFRRTMPTRSPRSGSQRRSWATPGASPRPSLAEAGRHLRFTELQAHSIRITSRAGGAPGATILAQRVLCPARLPPLTSRD